MRRVTRHLAAVSLRKCSRSTDVAELELICSGTFSAPVLGSDHSFRSTETRREHEMDLPAALAFLDSDSEDEDPPFVIPDFWKEDDEQSNNMVLLFGLAAYYSAGSQSGVRGADRSKIDEWYEELMEGDHEDFRRGMRLNRNSFDFVLQKVTPYLLTERDRAGKPRIDVEKRVAATIW